MAKKTTTGPRLLVLRARKVGTLVRRQRTSVRVKLATASDKALAVADERVFRYMTEDGPRQDLVAAADTNLRREKNN